MKRAVVHRCSRYEEQATISHRSYSWRAIKVTTVYFECGHTRVYRGMSEGPKKLGFCKACEAGKKPVPLPDPLPKSATQRGIEPLAEAILAKAREDAREERDLPDSEQVI